MRITATQWTWADDCQSAAEITENNVRTVYFISNSDSLKPFCPAVDDSRSINESNGAPIALEHKQTHEKQRTHCQKRCVVPFGMSSASTAGNPNCLNFLGQQRWLDEDKAFRDYCAARLQANNLPDPLAMVRDSTVPVGLKNLGATCYLNAFLQTWFNINRFRAGVYQIPVRDSNSPIYQLQLLFGHLQNGLQKYYNPRPFVESMGLVETEQQDANEFYRLFIGLLENQIEDFRRGGHADVVNFVSDLLGGVYAHSTQCQNCHTKSTRPEVFSQFELHIKDKITLGQCLQDYLREEVLDGANQYFCSVCKSKQDALRFTELRKLPLLLNFQLMRFVIDMQSENFHKKKTNHLVKFPLSIDMREFLADGCADPQESYVYDLKSVLLHRGESAYRGHYMAHVYDQERECWFRFNDEEVEDLTGTDKRFMFDINPTADERPAAAAASSDKSTPAASSSKEEPATGGKKNPNESAVYSSRNTYMLIYEKRQIREITATAVTTQLPQNIASSVDADNFQFQTDIDQHRKQNESMRQDFTALREERLSAISSWRLKTPTEPSYFIPADWLTDWLEKPFRADFDLTEFRSHLIDLRPFLCKHKLLDYRTVHRLKRLAKPAGDLLFSGQQPVYHFNPPLPLINDDCLCKECVREEYRRRTFIERHGQLADNLHIIIRQHEIASQTKRRKSNVAEKIIMSAKRVKAKSDEDAGAGDPIWISKNWLKEWMKKTPFSDGSGETDKDFTHRIPLPIDKPFIDDVYCEHGALALDGSGKRLIPQHAWEYLLEHVEGLQEALTDSPYKVQTEHAVECDQCIQLDAKQSERNSERKLEARREKLILKDLATGYRPLSVLFTTVTQQTSTSAANGKRKSFSIPADSYYALSTKFLTEWRRWLDSPNQIDRPQFVDNTDLLCEHNRLCYDINQLQNEQGWLSELSNYLPWESAAAAAANENAPPKDSGRFLFRPPLPLASTLKLFGPGDMPPFVLVTSREWSSLKDLYNGQAGPAIHIAGRQLDFTDVESGGQFKFDIAFAWQDQPLSEDRQQQQEHWGSAVEVARRLPCWQCTWQQRFDWVEVTITIRRVDARTADLERLVNELGTQPVPRLVQLAPEEGDSSEENEPRRRNAGRRKAALASRKRMIVSDNDDAKDNESDDNSTGNGNSNNKKSLGSKRQKQKPAAPPSASVQLDIKSFLVPKKTITASNNGSTTAAVSTNGTPLLAKRSSTRSRNKASCKLHVLKGDSVKDLKVRIMYELNVTPIYQRLFHMGQEWVDNEATMEQLHVMPNSIVDLLVLCPDDEEPSEDEHIQQAESGFRGTLLYSLTTSSTPAMASLEQSREHSVAPLSDHPEEVGETPHSIEQQPPETPQSIGQQPTETPHSIEQRPTETPGEPSEVIMIVDEERQPKQSTQESQPQTTRKRQRKGAEAVAAPEQRSANRRSRMEWDCAKCTFHNTGGSLVCSVCNNARRP